MQTSAAFATTFHVAPRKKRSGKCMCRRRGVSFATAAVPSSASPTDDAEPTIPIPGTPCFTPRVSRSPMPEEDRQTYIVAASAAFRTYLESSAASSRGRVELRVPQLDPSSDVYCRRFLLSLTWALVRVAAVQAGLRTRILVQKPGDFYGGLPLSVAGLARFLAADWRVSKDGWPEDMVRLGAMGRDERIADDDEVIVIVSPTNAISMPVVEDLQRLSVEAGDRPIVLINPRLGDVPSHSGVMQVSGRKERMQLLDSFQDIFTCRLLYQSAKVYPVEGALYHAYPGDWQVWKALDNESGYDRIATFEEKPDTSEITAAFARDRAERDQRRLEEYAREHGNGIPLPMLLSSAALSIAGTAWYMLHF